MGDNKKYHRHLFAFLVLFLVTTDTQNLASSDGYPLPIILKGRHSTLVLTMKEPWVGGTLDTIRDLKMRIDLPWLLEILRAMEKVIKTSPVLDAFLIRFDTIGGNLNTPTQLFIGSIEYPTGKTIEDIWQETLDIDTHESMVSNLCAPLAQAASCRTKRLERHRIKGLPTVRHYADCSGNKGSIEVIGDVMPRDNDALIFVLTIDPKARDRELTIVNDMLDTLRIVR